MDKKETIVNIKKIAEDLGLSTTTVSRAISGKGRIGRKTIERVHGYMAENGLVPNVYSKCAEDKRTHMICVVLPLEEDYAELPFFQKILLSLYDFFSLYEYHVMVVKTTWTDISALKKVVKEQLVDGVVLTRTLEDGQEIEFLKDKGIPFVVTGSCEDRSVLQVDVDHLNACFDLTTSLLRMGIRDIALMIAERTQIVNVSRYRGFEKAFEDYGLDIDRKMIFENAGYDMIAEDLTLEAIKKGAECILCMDDNICLFVLKALRKHCMEIPRDIKVASFYNSRLLDEYFPTISCVNFDIRKLGSTAGKVLLDRLNGDTSPKKIVLGYNVVLKDSTKEMIG